MPRGSRARSLGVAASLLAVAGCGGGVPLLHPAHVLPSGRVRTGAGVSGEFSFRSEARPPRDPEQASFEDAVARAALSPGVAPWVGARAGLGARIEGGLAYTGRAVRLDARRAFGGETVAVSVGAGASAVFARATGPDERGGMRPPNDRVVPGGGPELAANGFGFDVPVLIGYRSTASVVQAWAGLRGGVERITGDLPLAPLPNAPPPAPPPAELAVTRWYGGGLVGAAVGLAPFYVAVELDVAYQGVSATAAFDPRGGPGPGRREGSVSGFTLAPAGAILGKF